MRSVLTVAMGLTLSACVSHAKGGGVAGAVQGAEAPAPILVERGWSEFQRGEARRALQHFQAAVRRDPNHAPAYYGVAYMHSVQGELGKAIDYYRRTLVHDQTYPYTFANLGYALLQVGRHEEGLANLDRALELMPDCGEAHLSYANYHALKGDWKAAGVSVRRAIDCGQEIHPKFRSLLESHGVNFAAGSSESMALGAAAQRERR